jgi:hypothetical protein
MTEAERLDVRDKAVIVLCELLFDDPHKIIQQIKTHRLLFLRVSLYLFVLLFIQIN